jgi:hypothetical protein
VKRSLSLTLEPELGGRYLDEREVLDLLLDAFPYLGLSRREGRVAARAQAARLRARKLPKRLVDAALDLGEESFAFVARDAADAATWVAGTYVPFQAIPVELSSEAARPLARRLARKLCYVSARAPAAAGPPAR